MNQHKKRRDGFTLLELLLVVVILSAIAFMVLGTTGDQINQVRYEDTRNRLEAIRTAILGPSGTAVWEHGVQSGFVVDNGVLPDSIDALVNLPFDDPVTPTAYYDEFGPVAPVYDQGGSEEFKFENAPNPEQYQLMKGHRGSYLAASPGGWYRDGWGTNRSIDGAEGIAECPSYERFGLVDAQASSSDLEDANHGWCVTHYDSSDASINDELYIDSYGMDGKPGATLDAPYEDYEADMPMSQPIRSHEWQVDVAGASVRVVNRTGGDITLPSGVNASLLVYSNDWNGDGPTWETISATATNVDIDLDNGDGMHDDDDNSGTPDVAWGESQEIDVKFPGGTQMIPIGEHLLVLTSGDKPDLSGINGWPSSASYVTAKVKFFPRGGVPEMVLEIR